jgi:hypothetical protein
MDRRINGVMVDCSRLIERREYYYRLLDFMAQWRMNLLLLHFSDDHGLSIRLPGFQDIAAPRAFSPREIRSLIRYAARRGIELVPEIETFGHVRFLTDHPDFAHLRVGRRTRNLSFNAIDPLQPESARVMERLIRQVAKLFPSRWLHIGCDEVNLEACCRRRPELDPDELWCQHVNRMIALARRHRRVPVFWADHPAGNRRIRQMMRKDAVAVWWNYRTRPTESELKSLQRAGFRRVICAPAAAWWLVRFLSGRSVMTNMEKMARFSARHRALGVISTVWCPYRYVQGSLYYALAYGAEAARAGGKPNLSRFNRTFVRRVFGREITPDAVAFLKAWPDLEITTDMVTTLCEPGRRPTTGTVRRMRRLNLLWRARRRRASRFRPTRNGDIWEAMKLAADAAGILTEWFLLSRGSGKQTQRKKDYNLELKRIRRALSGDWDAGRCADDPRKYHPAFPNQRNEVMLGVMKRLPYFRVTHGNEGAGDALFPRIRVNLAHST